MTADEDQIAPSFPPLMEGLEAARGEDPFALACARAQEGCDAGLITHAITADTLSAALVLAPEVPLGKAMVMLPTLGIGLQNALGVLAPPEVAVLLSWDGYILVNGARCGRFRVAASEGEPTEPPGWLVVGFTLQLIPQDPETPGLTPDQTSLYDEGCSEVLPPLLLEAWARHSLLWINRWDDEGVKPLHAEWEGLVVKLGDAVDFTLPGGERVQGTFIGVDEDFGMLLRPQSDTGADADAETDAGDATAQTTRLLPLTDLLEGTPCR